MNITADQRQMLDKYLPWILAALAAWVLARGLKKMLWTAFGFAWLLYWTGGMYWLHDIF